nr:UvrD-helicase domain-containing protein [Methylobacillus rhizosphaerae]
MNSTAPTLLLAGLNDKQLEAVTLPHQSALILAGAGSGKTRVLTTRIAWLIQTGQVSPHGILSVTFTNKAAKEMLTRLGAMLPINIRGMWAGTFHGLCNRLLRAHHREVNLPATFQILDTADQLSAIKRIMKVMNVDDEKFPPKQVLGYINSCKEEGLRAYAVESYDSHSQRMREIFEEYDKQCQREGVVDFAELLLRCYELLSNNASIREHYQHRFRYILVDEFQDTNRLQYLWLRLLAGSDNCIFAVGDDDQSIYAFRGARVGNMRDFEHDFNVQNIVKLEQNYRSHSNILDAANAIIMHNRNRLGKNLWTSAGKGEPIRVYEGYNDKDEAVFIVDEIKALHAEGMELGQIALLYRSNAQSRILEHELFSAGLPYRVYGGLRFFERAEVKHALAYLRLIASGDDDTALLRVINFPTRGIGARSLEQLQELARQQDSSLWQAACTKAGDGKPGRGLDGFVALIKQMQEESIGLTLPEQVELATRLSGLRDHYAADKEGEDRIANLDELVNAAIAFNNQEIGMQVDENGEVAMSILAQFLAHASLESGEHQADAGRDALQLMTVHAAKGLEFNTVFISGVEEGLFPHEQSSFEANGLEEERRLMYVAVTRARQRLYLSFAQSRMLHGQVRYGIPSRFLDEIPEELTKRLNSIGSKSNGYNQPVPVAPVARPQANMPWKIGQAVAHSKFGQGVVVNYEGNANDLRVQVNFGKAGMKWLALEYAKLETL